MSLRETPWTLWENLAKRASNSELTHIVEDCREAEIAMRGWNPDLEGYYSDQAATYQMEIRRRATA